MDWNQGRGFVSTALNRYFEETNTRKFGFTIELLYLLFLRHISDFTKHNSVANEAVGLFYVLSI